MAQSFPETAHLKTDLKKYQENYDRIFNKRKLEEEATKEEESKEEKMPISGSKDDVSIY